MSDHGVLKCLKQWNVIGGLPTVAVRWLIVFLLLSTPLMVAADLSEIRLRPLVEYGLGAPVAITSAGDSRLFIVEQTGLVRIYDLIEHRLLPEPFLDLSGPAGPVLSGGERGLLSVAFHPDYSNNGWFFVDYTSKAAGSIAEGATVIARYRVSSEADRADPASARVLLVIPQEAPNHNGGQLQFGADGYLYIGMGDGGGANDPSCNAQDPASRLGKMLRIDVDRNTDVPPYHAIPASNPFVGNPDYELAIWGLGLRNPWRFSFDRLTGDLYIADVGQSDWEEVDFQPAGSAGGENYGWKIMEGNHCGTKDTAGCSMDWDIPNCFDDSYTDPVIEYDHDVGRSITGGYVYRGARFSELVGRYLFGDFPTGKVWAAQQTQAGWQTIELGFTAPGLTTFGEDQAGELYLASDGMVYRLSDGTQPFNDVSTGHWVYTASKALFDAGISEGCGNGNFCPEQVVARSLPAIWLLRAIEGGGYTPPPATGSVFSDVGLGGFAADWIEELAARGITEGCNAAGTRYCPAQSLNRDSVAKLLLRAIEGGGYSPPVATGEFDDVPASDPFAPWIEELFKRGISAGCDGFNYCPDAPVTNAEFAVLLARAFDLQP